MKHRTWFTLAFAILLAGCLESGDGSSSGTAGKESGCEFDGYRALMLERVNAARAEARDCGLERYPATQPLSYSCQLDEAAARHSQDMATQNFYSHTGSDGLQVSNRVTATGYTWSAVGENIAAGYSSVEAVMQGWLESPGHCRNIMSDQYREFAVSRVDVNDSDYSSYWTQVFGTQP